MNAPEAVTPVTLWRGDHYEGNSFFLSESKHQRREEWKALPAAQYAELVAYAKTGEAVEGVLIEANEDDGTMTPADVVRALVAERDALREAVIEARMYVEAFDTSEESSLDALATVKVDIPEGKCPMTYAVNAAHATLARIATALGAERAT